jgi:hypothetical protein
MSRVGLDCTPGRRGGRTITTHQQRRRWKVHRQLASLQKLRGTKLAALAVCAVAAPATLGIAAAPARAQRVWGCTNKAGHECVAPWAGYVNFLITQHSDHAVGFIFGMENGYPPPKYDNRERYVCSSMYNIPSVPWVCQWGQNSRTFPYVYGQAEISLGAGVNGVAVSGRLLRPVAAEPQIYSNDDDLTQITTPAGQTCST